MKSFYIFFFIGLTTVVQAQYVTKISERVVNDSLRNMTINIKTTEKKSKKVVLHEFYFEKKVETMYFNSDNALVLKTTHITKRGTYGKPCNEILFEQKEFYPNSKLKREYKSKCDCHNEIEKIYNSKSQIVHRKKTSRPWIRQAEKNNPSK